MTQTNGIDTNKQLEQGHIEEESGGYLPAPDLATMEKAKRHRVPRDGALDLVFYGWEIGDGATRWCSGRRAVVTIYATTKGAIVVHRNRATQWEKERDMHDAWVARTAVELHQVLRNDSYDGASLGMASKEALEVACKHYPPLAGQDLEEV